MQSIPHILAALDLDALGADLGVKPRSFRLARERDVFPAAWYPTVKRHCEAVGLDCPMGLFNWRSPSSDDADGSPACGSTHSTSGKAKEVSPGSTGGAQ